eukprot:TRINITY_DN17531_c0_g1_i1.p1 TRINITY_DN17531_c0_g1~~TRINITY_DN17531_c0_g1_i1.p1  ORF type:complete len:307 (-),score=68.48 TRINITY_DN17531_c0_g1_i1:98-1018(-)
MGCCGSTFVYEKFNPASAATSGEVSYGEASAVVRSGGEIIELLRNYRGCEKAIRQAITNPTPEAESAALEQLLPAVDVLQRFYDFSKVIEAVLPKLFSVLCTDDPIESIYQNQATVKMLGEVFDFILHFDDLKMVNPAIQNDFSYYRRTLNRLKLAKQDNASNIKVTGEIANRMSLFFAYPTPMMRSLIDTTQGYLTSGANGSKLIPAIGHLANYFSNYLTLCQKDGETPDQPLKIVSYITGCIVLYDQVNPDGAFKSNSPIQVREAFRNVKQFSQGNALFANAIRFTTLHFNDASTPESIKSILS